MPEESETPRPYGKPRTISTAAADRIIFATGLSPRNGVNSRLLAKALNIVIYESFAGAPGSGQLTKERLQQIEKLSKAFHTYEEMSVQLREHDLFPPRMPVAFREDVSRWLSDMRLQAKQLDLKRTGRPPSPLRDFYPTAIGLFKAVFGRKPRIDIDPDSGRVGPLGNFILQSVRESVSPEATTPLICHSATLVSKKLEWQVPPLGTLRKQLMEAMREQSPDLQSFPNLTGHRSSNGLRWEHAEVCWRGSLDAWSGAHGEAPTSAGRK